jgi:hypothetical protein
MSWLITGRQVDAADPDARAYLAAVEAADTHDRAIDVVGAITRGGEYDPETGEVLVPPTVLDGWHVNYLGDLPDGWEEYAVSPEQPVRVFAA